MTDDDSDFSSDGDYNSDICSDIDANEECERSRAIRVYEAACKRCAATPAKQILDQISSKFMNLENHCLAQIDVKVLCISLVGNVTVTDVNLAGNNIGPIGASRVAQVISENPYISILNLSDNHITGEGLIHLSRALLKNKRIRTLNLSGNDLSEDDAVYIANILKANTSIKDLCLSHNEFRERGGEVLAPAIGGNKTLERLDLSWNHLRMKGAAALAKCLQVNTGLKYINFSWNGFWVEGCQQLQIALEKNRTLREIDLSANRIEAKAVGYLIKGVCRNPRLKIIRLGGNPIHCELATKILKDFELSPHCGLRLLDITDVTIEEEFQHLLHSIQRKRRLTVVHGNVVNVVKRGLARQLSVFDMPTDPLLVLFEYMKQSNLRLVDFFHVLDKDSSETVSKSEFRQVLQRVNIPMTERALAALMRRLDSNNDGQVDFSEFLNGHRDNLRKLSVITEDPMRVEEMGRLKEKIKTFLELRKESLAKHTAKYSLPKAPSTDPSKEKWKII